MNDFFNKFTLGEWGAIGNIVLGISSVVTAIFTAYALIRQCNLQKESLLVQQSTQQPVFNIYYELIDFDNDGKYENEILNISNEGLLYKSITNISVTTIFDVGINHTHSLLKIDGYFCATTIYQNMQGLIYKSRGNNNRLKYMSIYQDMLQQSNVIERFYEMHRYDLVKIEYIDIYNKHKTCYFKDRINVSEHTYNNDLENIVNKQDVCDINNISFEDLFVSR